MLQIIRDRAQGLIVWTIVGLIIVTFALFGLGSYLSGSTSTAVASVDGNEISQNEFQRAYQNYQNRLREMLGESYRADIFNPAIMKQEVLNGLINQRLVTQYLEEQKIFPADQLIAEEIHSISAFKDENDKFSNERYQELLSRQGMSPVGFEADLARDIAGQQIATALTKTAIVTSSELALYQRLKHQQREIGYLLLEKAAYIGSAKPSAEAIEQFYKANANDFMTPEQIKLRYVELDLEKRSANITIDDAKIKNYYDTHRSSYVKQAEQRKASHILITVNKDTDDAAAQKVLEDILAEYKAGKSFVELAKQHSQDPGSAKQGGDLGFFGRSVMDKAFEDAAFALKKQEVSQPVKSRFGYHLILVTDIRPAVHRPFAEVKDQIKKQLQMTEAEQDFYVDAEKLDNLSYDVADSLDAVVDELGLQLKQTEFLGRQGGKGLFANQKLIAAAFSDEVLNQGRNSSVIEVSSTHLVVLRVAQHQVAKQMPMEDVKTIITHRLKLQTAQQQAAKDAQTAVTDIKAGRDAREWSNENKKGQWFKPRYIGRNVNLDPAADNEKDKKIMLPIEVRQNAFAMPSPQDGSVTADTVTLANGDTAVMVLYKVRDTSADASLETKYKQQLQAALGSADYNSFIQELRDKADITMQIDNIQE